MLGAIPFNSTLNSKHERLKFSPQHVLVCCLWHTQYIKIGSIFQRFQIKERVLRVNKAKIAGDNAVNLGHLDISILKVTMNRLRTKKHCFTYFCRFLTGVLILRMPIIYISIVRAFLVFLIFKPVFVIFTSQE